MSYDRRRYICRCSWEHYVWLPRIWAILTATGLWGVGAEISYRRNTIGIYILLVAILVSFLEVIFAINICIVLCVRDDSGGCLYVWRKILWLDDWKKGLLYIVLSIGCFTQASVEWLSLIIGVMLVISGILYAVKTYKTRLDERLQQLLRQDSTYDRFDELSADIDIIGDPELQRTNIIINNSILVHNSMDGHISVPSDDEDSYTDSIGIAEQDEILEV